MGLGSVDRHAAENRTVGLGIAEITSLKIRGNSSLVHALSKVGETSYDRMNRPVGYIQPNPSSTFLWRILWLTN